MINQKDISTWNSDDVINWLKSLNMTQYLSKFESNKINGYDLIYLTKEDLKSLGIVSIHDKNVILNSMKDSLLQQLRLNINFKDKYVIIQLDFDPNFTVEQLTNTLKNIFKPVSSIFLVTNNNEILMPNLKIIDLILYNPTIYKNFKIMLDTQLANSNINYSNKDCMNNNNDLSKNNILNNIPRKQINAKNFDNYYKLNVEENYKNENNDIKLFNKTDFNNKEKYQNNFITLDNNNYNKEYLEKKDKYNINSNRNNTNNNEIKYNLEEKMINQYKNYGDFIKNNNLNNYETEINNKNITNYEKVDNKKELKIKKNQGIGISLNKEFNSNNNNIYDYNRNITPIQNDSKRTKTSSTYRKKYTIDNGELNFEIQEEKFKNKINNINYSSLGKDEEENQKFSSEKRNFRTGVNNSRVNYENNNLDNNYMNKNNYNYRANNGIMTRNNFDLNSLIGKDKVNDKMNNTTGFNEFRQYNNTNDMNLNNYNINEKN